MSALSDHAAGAGIALESQNPVTQIAVENNKCMGVNCADGSTYSAPVVINCAGAWAAQITGGPVIPTRPVKGQMLALDPEYPALRHVVRCGPSQVYMLPRTTGVIAIGATVEEAGFDRATNEEAVTRLHAEAAKVLPALARATVQETWAGLRPCSPDGMPILGETFLPGYFAATGHFRHGILLAPATAEAMSQLILTGNSDIDLSSFSPRRFAMVRN
jgi:glycine oxidase